MSGLLWPGDDRAGDLMSDSALLAAMVEVEQAWLTALVRSGIAPRAAGHALHGLVSTDDLPALASAAADGGNPVIPLVTMLRDRLVLDDFFNGIQRQTGLQPAAHHVRRTITTSSPRNATS